MEMEVRNRAVDPAVLQEIVRRIVAVAQPAKIILFGSAARGTMGPDSDVDLLVVKAGDFHRGRLTDVIYEALSGVGVATDIIVAKPEDIERYRDSLLCVFRPALAEGRVVYAA